MDGERAPHDLASMVQRLHDRVEVLETLYAYCRHADARDAEQMTAVFTDDCRVSYHPEGGPTFEGRAAMLESRRASLARTISGSHHIANPELIWDGPDTVIGHFYMYSWQRFHGHPVTADCHRWGRYECRFVRTAEGWRIARMQLVSAGEYGGARIGEHLGRPFPPHFE